MKKTLALCGVASMALVSPMAQAVIDTLESAHTETEISIDGARDKAWDNAKPINIVVDELPYKPNNGYEGMKEAEIEMRSLHDGEYVYFLLRWEDPTLSLERYPWVKQEDGSWKRLVNKDSTGHENTFYEDKMSIFWNIKSKGFKKKGCDKSCHMPEDDGLLDGVKDTSAGRHYTSEAGETIDMWHWKAARTNANFQMDDQYVDHARQESKEWGRHSDDKTGGGYYYNLEKGRDTPVWMNKTPSAEDLYWVREALKVPFEDKGFKPGDIIGGHVTGPFEGPRADIQARGEWQDGAWIVEIKRKLVTNHENSNTQDIQFNDLDKDYYFGVTVFDNAQINHIHHTKSYKMVFGN
ncbi:ethylbenzene dehydrogenase [Motiliproteus coralliicola]|uniref:Ethylbenzene dehydrogenase n=1 Tax=Motiliproteus coralliicola TaxID=2283196 RepID=A0A369WVX1_9GAMM|nr:ethylbenzene dehydrogenase-related protein [Motiliproteus coralliicola]RDE25263.1 ethylbenzene dehydrogenase [Motiliproteus coralliicola]